MSAEDLEIWKPIKDYEGEYEVSNFGNVKSLKSNIILKPRVNQGGYRRVILCKNGKVKNIGINRLVAKAFLEDWNEKLIVEHRDRNTINNNINNLRMATSSENGCNRKVSSNNKLGLKNIRECHQRNVFIVRVKVKGKTVTKCFISLLEAFNFSNEMRKEKHGGFAFIDENPPEDVILDGKNKTYICKNCGKELIIMYKSGHNKICKK